MSVALRIASLAVLTASLIAAHATPAEAQRQRKPQPACGIKPLPFFEGSQWVYMAVAPPDDVKAQALKIAANKPKQPAEVTIKVVSIQEVEGVTEITLEETSDVQIDGNSNKTTVNTKLTCTKDKLDVPPDSFFFVGEPGGVVAMELANVTRGEDMNSYVFQLGTLRVPEWIENVKGEFKRVPHQGSDADIKPGLLDLQRIVKRGVPEPITTAFGTYDAYPVQVELVGSVTVSFDPAEEFSIPANTVNKLWMADNVGVVQVFNSNGHMFQLTSATLPE